MGIRYSLAEPRAIGKEPSMPNRAFLLRFLGPSVLVASLLLAAWYWHGSYRADAGKKDDVNPVKLGHNASFGGKRLFPDDNPWNQDISKEAVDPNSDNLIASIGKDRPLHPDFG